MRYGIVGFGTAGYHGVKEIRKYDPTGTIHVYGDTGMAPYNPMLTTYYAAGKLSYEGMFPFGTLEEMEKKYGFSYEKRPVKRVCAKERSIETDQGSAVHGGDQGGGAFESAGNRHLSGGSGRSDLSSVCVSGCGPGN